MKRRTPPEGIESRHLRRIEREFKRKIGIVISHRFLTVQIADRIAIIDEGHIKELGTHHELLAAGNTYARLFELQASGYR